MGSQGRIQDFKLEGAHLKKLRRAEGGAKIVGVFLVKITILRQKIISFPILGGARAGCARPLPLWIRPGVTCDAFIPPTSQRVGKRGRE